MAKLPWILLIGLLLVAGVVSLLAKVLHHSDTGLSKVWPLEPRRYLLSERERALFQRLVQSLPDHIVLTQVQLLRALEFKRGQWSQTIFNKIRQLSVDFLILNTDTSICAAIELDDVTHEHAKRRAADARKTHALKSAGVPLIRWNAKSLPDAGTICAALMGTNSPLPASS
jgi:very-short-patch-repair endonuclease